MKLLSLLCAAFLATPSGFAQTVDPVVMKINNASVSRSEFEFWYNRDRASSSEISEITVEEYAPLFIRCQLQLAEAYALKLDTISSLKADYNELRDKAVNIALVSDAELDAEARRVYNETKANVGTRGLIHPAHILIYVGQNATNAELENARSLADSLYTAIKNGADFEELARKYSSGDGSAQHGGVLPWIQPNQTLKEFEDAAYALQVGEVSKPVLSPMGFHVIKMLERKELEPYDSIRGSIIKMLDERRVREQIVKGKVADVMKASNGTLTLRQALDKTKADAVNNDPKLRMEIKFLHDELLMAEVYNRHFDSMKPYTEAALKAFFNKNKKRYYWDEPRFRGVIIHAKTVQDIQKVKDCIKDLPYAMWDDAIEKTFNSGAKKRVKYEMGLFVKGQNKFVDSAMDKGKVFETGGDEFPYTDVYGKTLKKKAVTYDDVSPWVEADYESELYEQWIKSLEKKYQVEVFHDILKTVNQDNK